MPDVQLRIRQLAPLAVALAIALAGPARAQLSSTGNQLLIEGQDGLGGVAAAGDRFGAPLAVGDFDHDGFADLAGAGAPFENVGSVDAAGKVHVIYGSRQGLTGSGDQILSEDTAGVPGVAEIYDYFGQALAAGDFDCDGFDDLAIGAPNEAIGSGLLTIPNAGAVWVIFGSPSGLAASTAISMDQNDLPSGTDTAEHWDLFGAALVFLASTSSDGASHRALMVGAPGEGVLFGSFSDQGRVFMFRNDCPGSRTFDFQGSFDQDVAGMAGTPEDGDRFGWALGKGDFDGDGRDDLVIGVPGEGIGSAARAGAISVLPGNAAGSWSGSDEVFWSQDSTGVQGTAEADDWWGGAFASGDFDHDGRDDLAVGAASEDLGSTVAAGIAQVLYGSASGLTDAGDQIWSRENLSGGLREAWLGTSLASGDFDGDGTADLGIGAPGDIRSFLEGRGSINAVYGRAFFGLDTPGSQELDQDSVGFQGIQEDEDAFGEAVAAGDFNGDGLDDLAVGVPGESLAGVNGAGLVQVIYGSEGGVLGRAAFSTSSVAVVTEAATMVTFTVRRVGATNLAASVSHQLAAGATATLGSDFNYTSGTLAWSAGDATDRTFTVTILNDAIHEATEFLTIQLIAPSPSGQFGLASPASRTIQINDDDPLPPLLSDDFEAGTLTIWSSTHP